MKQRYVEVIHLLTAWAPLTASSVFDASRGFEQPYSSMKQCRRELSDMVRGGLVGREEVPDTGRGQKPFAYHLRRRASHLVPQLSDIPKSNALFRRLGRNPWHSLAVGQVGARLEADAENVEGRVEVLERVRDRQFHADLSKHGLTRLIPDATVLVRIDGRLRVLFLELVHETAVLNPGSDRTRARSLAGKLERYRAFNERRRLHSLWWSLERAYGYIHGFQVLVVTTRNNMQHLLAAAPNSNTMCLFAELDSLMSYGNVFTDPLWWLPPSRRWKRLHPAAVAIAHE